MLAPPLPEDELLRLQVLHALCILDSGPEERFDRLTRMARRVFSVPIALVSLLDLNRQWFKSCQGLGVNETGRDVSFCGHAILGDEIFVIPDATGDNRFADNPLVTGDPHIRFYAGCPLRVSRGAKVGTLCIIDQQPRGFGSEDAQALRDLAAMVEDELSAYQAAMTDPLTRIWNRRGFLTMARDSLALCEAQGQGGTLVCLDLDGFKQINDRHGHAAGDAVLERIAFGMSKCFRSTDVFARIGGDEFVAWMPGSDAVEARGATARLTDWLQGQELALGLPYRSGFSAGYVDHPAGSGADIQALLSEADAAMYAMKSARRSAG
ncbi:GGDEF domain-containing protein [Sandarakinorhabdus cyanobacteriorum]|uniref:GGDEF domain-containing protein n=1 Tax=Sandarakinorhabdus cyanobacteriorum TaxID=1981098 RepID=A0A255Y960_9SPHN|nr:sensor domain-containing diguanylate cyclase [Sandarakinorhabdus cyanobacteriorum]OYQ25776.1 GGDEF domain-containing protein [Sandarakinorhabdus cyanobacteriorum]